jgi:single-stranded DNA-specific DHH superfamily exonuclease
MDWITKQELGKLEAFLSAPGKKTLFYHRDSDGVCSAALFLKFFRNFSAVPREGPRMETGFVEDLIKDRPDAVVFLDLPVCQEWRNMNRIRKALPGLKIAVIDHHIPEKNLNSKNVLHLNPKFRMDVYWPVSYLMFDLLERLGRKPEPLIWIAAMGVIGD